MLERRAPSWFERDETTWGAAVEAARASMGARAARRAAVRRSDILTAARSERVGWREREKESVVSGRLRLGGLSGELVVLDLLQLPGLP